MQGLYCPIFKLAQVVVTEANRGRARTAKQMLTDNEAAVLYVTAMQACHIKPHTRVTLSCLHLFLFHSVHYGYPLDHIHNNVYGTHKNIFSLFSLFNAQHLPVVGKSSSMLKTVTHQCLCLREVRVPYLDLFYLSEEAAGEPLI